MSLYPCYKRNFHWNLHLIYRRDILLMNYAEKQLVVRTSLSVIVIERKWCSRKCGVRNNMVCQIIWCSWKYGVRIITFLNCDIHYDLRIDI